MRDALRQRNRGDGAIPPGAFQGDLATDPATRSGQIDVLKQRIRGIQAEAEKGRVVEEDLT